METVSQLYLLALSIILCISVTLSRDLCAHPNLKDIRDVMQKSVAPAAGSAAGQFRIIRKIDNILDCAMSCCAHKSCNIAFFHRKACYLIICNTTNPEGCRPRRRTSATFKNTMMITLRDVMTSEEKPSALPETNDGQRPSNSDSTTSNSNEKLDTLDWQQCHPDTGHEDCSVLETCVQQAGTNDQYLCHCRVGLRRDKKSLKCIEKPSELKTTSSPVVTKKPWRPQKCVFGLLSECNKNEECITNHPETDKGYCHCRDNFHRDSNHKCVPIKSHVPVRPTPISAPPAATTAPMSGIISSNTTSNMTANSTTDHDGTTTPSPTVERLIVNVGKNRTIYLPQNHVTLEAFVIPKETDRVHYQYNWALVSMPKSKDAKTGNMKGKNSQKLELTKLILGKYVFKLSVTGKGYYGDTVVQVVVKPTKRKNRPPVAVIMPKHQEVKLPNNAVLDGTKSHDDGKIVSYKWEEVSGPLKSRSLKGSAEMLQLKHLDPGAYVFKLTVTDNDGARDSTTANVTVIKEVDYPPVANAGQNVIINLPRNSITLFGNGSTDDKGIKSYEWTKSGDDKLTADMTGVRTPLLKLQNLEVGVYTFQLKVVDTSGQEAKAEVKVFVKPKHNNAPTAKAGPSQTVTLPLKEVRLNGSGSSDDEKIVKYHWVQVSGDHSLIIKHPNTAKPAVSELKMGTYKFRLTVVDREGLEAEDVTTLTVQVRSNLKPKARAGGDHVVTLPVDLVRLDGSHSWDDKKIVSYLWTRDDNSLAAGKVLNNSDHQAILMLSDLVVGRYQFLLRVTDAEGDFSEDTASLKVRADPHERSLLELHLATNVRDFNQKNKITLESQMNLLLQKSFPHRNPAVVIKSIKRDFSTGNMVVIFHVQADSIHKEDSSADKKKSETSKSREPLSGRTVLESLRPKLLQSEASVLDYSVRRFDTYVCQNNCSGHGKCHPTSKRCICDPFWMESWSRLRFGDHETNCDWSVIYVIISFCASMVLIGCLVWSFVCCRRRCRRPRSKRHKYTLLDEFDEKDGNDFNLKATKKQGNGHAGGTAIQMMPSDLSSEEDEETIFVNRTSNANGLLPAATAVLGKSSSTKGNSSKNSKAA